MLKTQAFYFILFGLVMNLPTHRLLAQTENYDSLLQNYLAEDSVLLNELEIQLASESMDVFDLIDSLLNAKIVGSQLTIRTGYTSDISYAGRTFGFNQYGFNAGVAYYHSSGLYADVSGFWNSDITPSYNPTITSIGYMGNLSLKWTYNFSYDHFFYNFDESAEDTYYYPLTNSLNAATYFDFGKFSATADYSFLFGEETAHRIRLGIMYTLTARNLGFIDRLTFVPGASIFLGSSNAYNVTPIYPEYNFETRWEVRQIMYREYGEAFVNYLWRNERDKYLALEKYTYVKYQDELTDYTLETDYVFGIMNYSLSAPIYFYINNFTIALSYYYNIPVELPGEDLELSPNSYVGVSLLYSIPFFKKKR